MFVYNFKHTKWNETKHRFISGALNIRWDYLQYPLIVSVTLI